ncbi:MAG TPA: cytochrome c oxidase assembly protein [Ktedonobacterales bacterium]|nr:cytochrome c oxidase assembly protein [Ktedonobacterales bacterium]
MAPTAVEVLLTGWNFAPSIVLGVAALCGAYLYAIGPLRRRLGWGEPVSRGQAAAFFGGTAVLAFALLSPLDRIGDDYLFFVHMIQHMLLMMVAAPLWVLGTPAWLLRVALRRPVARRVARFLTHPAVAFTLFNANFWLWHAPALYDATLSNEWLHAFEHLTFLATGVLNWIPIESPAPDVLPRLSLPGQIVYLFVSCQPMVLLGAGLTFIQAPLYAPYIAGPRIFGVAALTDQQVGGLIMWLPGNAMYLLAISVAFFHWLEGSAEARRAEREAWALEDAARATATGDAPATLSSSVE